MAWRGALIARELPKALIDTHCHLLPGLDDGPRSADESLELAAGLAEHGVRRVLCTPHYSRRYPTPHERALVAADALRLRLAAESVALDLDVAAEVSPVIALEATAVMLRVRSVGRRFVIVELEPTSSAPVVEAVCGRLAGFGLKPIFAHPERCRAVRGDLEPLDRARQAGALVQVVAPSLLGKWGSSAEDAAWRMLGTGRVDLLAGDTHRPASAASLGAAAELVAGRLGARLVRTLTVDNPARILQGLTSEPEPVR